MKTAIVTGASSGMGREFVRAIDREQKPEEIWIIARREDRLRALAEECDARVRVFALDLSDDGSFAVLREALASEKPDVTLLVNAAGYGLFGEFTAMEMEKQLGIVTLNDRALTAVTYLCLPYMKAGSAILNLGSNSSWQPVPYMNVYAASKAYVLSFSRGLWRELRPKGIHVMCVCPGWIKTEFFDTAVHDDTVRYYDRFYTAAQVVSRAMKDLKKKKLVSILGLPVRTQVRAVRFLPVKWVMETWCRQQGKGKSTGR